MSPRIWLEGKITLAQLRTYKRLQRYREMGVGNDLIGILEERIRICQRVRGDLREGRIL